MKSKTLYRLFVVLLVLSLSCNFMTQALPASVETGDFSAQATSPVSVKLEWKAPAGASGYQLEARYGADFFPVATLSTDRTGYEHFVVPGSTAITYRLSAGDEIGTVTVTMPELAANPLRVGFQESMPATPGFGFPTLDPNNPDPNNIDPNTIDPGTLFPPGFDPNDPGSFDPSALLKPVAVTQEVGPEGGTVTMTSPAGATFTLEVPPGALRETVPLTLAPMESLDEAPLPFDGGLLAAVQIQPVIPFDLTLTLHIQLAPDAPVPAAPLLVAGFDASGMSDELALHPIESDGDHAYSMRVDWGNTFGLAAAMPQEIAEQVKRVPTDAGAQMAQMIAATQLLAPQAGSDVAAVLSDQILDSLFAQLSQITVWMPSGSQMGSVDRPVRLSMGMSSAAEAQKSAIARQLRAMIERAREGYYMYQGSSRAMDLLKDLAGRIKSFLSRVEKQCLTEDALYAQEIINNLRGYSLEGSNLGFVVRNTFWEAVYQVYGTVEDLKSCRITLQVESSTIVVKLPDGSYYKMVAHTPPISLELVYHADRLRLRGAGPVNYDQFQVFFSFCPPATDLTNFPQAALWITDLEPLFDPNDGQLIDFALHRVMPDPIVSDLGGSGGNTAIDPGNCTLALSPTGSMPDFWTAGFTVMRRSNSDQNWSIEMQDPGLTATKDIAGRQQGQLTEDSRLILTVRPSE